MTKRALILCTSTLIAFSGLLRASDDLNEVLIVQAQTLSDCEQELAELAKATAVLGAQVDELHAVLALHTVNAKLVKGRK